MVSNPFGEPLEVAVTADTAGLESGLAGAMDQIGSMKGAVAGLGVALAGLSAKGLATAINSAASFEQQMVELEKVTDPTTAREMGVAIQDMASRMPLAQSELAGIAEQAGRLGIEGTGNIKNFTEVTAEMATATDLSAEEAADSFARMSTLMNEPIENVRAIGDATNALSNSMATSSSEITDAATRSAGALTNMGMKSSDILALNAAMNEVSPSARVAGTQLRRMAQEMMDPGKIDDMAAALGMSVSEFKAMRKEDPTQIIRMMAESMGEGGEAANRLRSTLSTTSRQALAGLSNNLDSMNKGLEVSEQQFKEGGSLAAEFESAMGTFKSTVQITRNNLRNLAISTGQLLLPALTEVMRAVNSLVSWFSSLNEASGGVIGVVTLLTGLFGGLIVAGGALVSMAGGLSAVLAPLVAGFSALGAAISILLGPIGILIGIVALLAAAWQTNFGGIRDQTMRVVGVLQEEFAPAIEWLRSVATAIFNQFGGEGSAAFSSLSKAAVPLIKLIADGLIVAIRGLAAVTRAFVAGAAVAWNALGPVITSVLATIQVAINEFMAWFGPIWRETMGPVMDEAAKTWSVWSQIVVYTLNTIRKNINAFLTWLDPYWNAYWTEFNAQFRVFTNEMRQIWAIVGDDVIATAQFVWDLVTSIVRGGLTIISGILRTIAAVMRADWATAWDIIHQTVVDVVSGIGAFVMDWGYRFVYRIGEIVLGVIDWFRRLGEELIWGSLVPRMLSDIKSAFSDFGRDVVRWISNFVKNFVRRIQNWASRVNTAWWNGLDQMYRALGRAGQQLKSRMASIANGVVQRVKNVGSKMYNAGKNLIKSIVRGVNKNPTAVKNAVASHVGKAAKFLPWSDAEEGPLSNLSKSGPGLVRTIAQGIRAESGRMSAAVREMVAGARAFLPSSDADTGPLSDLRAAGRSFGSTFAEGIRSSESEVTAAANSLAGAAQGALGSPTLNTGSGGGQQHPTLRDIINRDEELTPSGAREALSYLEGSELNHLAKAIGQTNWADGFSEARGLIQDFKAGGFSQDLFNALYLSEDANRGRAGVATTFAKLLNNEGQDSPPQNQTPNISAQFDSLAQSNRQAIQRLEGEMAQRLDTLISHAKTSEGVVRIDGQQAGTIIESTMNRKQYSTEIHE